jgi:hypothetical protein
VVDTGKDTLWIGAEIYPASKLRGGAPAMERETQAIVDSIRFRP